MILNIGVVLSEDDPIPQIEEIVPTPESPENQYLFGYALEPIMGIWRLVPTNLVLVILNHVDHIYTAEVPLDYKIETGPSPEKHHLLVSPIKSFDSQNGLDIARFTIDELKAKRVTIFSQSDNMGKKSVKLIEDFHASFRELGGETISTVSYSDGKTDFAEKFNWAKKCKDDIILIDTFGAYITFIRRVGKGSQNGSS